MSEITTPAERVRAPGIGLAVFGGLSVLVQIASLINELLGGPLQRALIERFAAEGTELPDVAQMGLGGGALFGLAGALSIVSGLVTLGLAAYVTWGGLSMLKRQHHGACIGAAIVAMLPCSSCCCLIGLPIGIWALITLNRADVRAAFGEA